MQIGIIGDVHWCEYSSIWRSRGKKYSSRLENCINSINWAEHLTRYCDLVVYLGDFFDKSNLNAEEITALNDIEFNGVPHRFLVGNHEMGINTLVFSSAHIFDGEEATSVIDKPCISETWSGPPDEVEICYLPYNLEENRKPLAEIFPPKHGKRIIFSHNDIAGIQMGKFISKAGYTIEEIEENCDMFFNGHLHNGMPITDKVINVGNLTGQNFSEDGFKYTHNAFIFDTDTWAYRAYPNPYAVSFYKVEDLKQLKYACQGVVTVKCKPAKAKHVKELLEKYEPIASRLIIDYSSTSRRQADMKKLSVDHLEEFRKFIYDKLEGQVDENLLREEVDCIYG